MLEIPLENIKSVRIASPVLWTRRKKEKLGILDVQLTMVFFPVIQFKIQDCYRDTLF